MIRLLVLLLLLLALIAGAGWLADRPGRIVIDWLDWRAETSVAALVALGGALVVLGLLLQRLWTLLRRDLPFSPARRAQRRLVRGHAALNAALVALAADDRHRAQALTRKALALLPPQPLTRLMGAEAARLAEDHATAKLHWQALADDPASAFLGLRGLIAEARRAGRPHEARRLAREAVALQPENARALTTLFDLEVHAADWQAALATLAKMHKARLTDREQTARRRAALLYGLAVERDLAGDHEGALTLAEQAADLRAGLVPASLLAVRLGKGRRKPAQLWRRLAASWAAAPHADLAAAALVLADGESADGRLARIRALVAAAPGHRESRVALATAALRAERPDIAREALGEGDDERDARLLRLRADLAELDGEEARATSLRREAETAPGAPLWSCESCAAQRDRWTPLCPSCGRFDSYRPGGASRDGDGRIAAGVPPLALLGDSANASKAPDSA